MTSAHDLARVVAGIAPNSKVDITYIRDGKTITGKIQIAELKDNSGQTQTASAAAGDVPALGLQLAPARDVAGAGDAGVAVVGVDPAGVAADNGVQEGDVILEVGGKTVNSPSDVTANLSQAKKDGRKAALIKLQTADGTRYWAANLTKAG